MADKKEKNEVKNVIKKLIRELLKTDVANIHLDGFNITIRTCDARQKIALSTPVYSGGNYIPKSVRHCVSGRNPFERYAMNTHLEIEEDTFSVYLHYLDEIAPINAKHFVDLLEDFSELAEKWRQHLDEHDQNDLVYAHR